MRKIWLGTAAILALLPMSVLAQSLLPVSGNLDVYYSYADQKVDQATSNPGGSGVGVAGQLNFPLYVLPVAFFVDALYQYNDENEAQFNVPATGPGFGNSGQQETVTGLGLADQVRAGGGLKFRVPEFPLVVYGKVDYVHYEFDGPTTVTPTPFGPDFGNARDNDDGVGYFGGFKTLGPWVQFYAQGGYLKLSDTQGQEYKVGVAVPIAPLSYRRYRPVELFAEYQWNSVHEHDGPYHDIYYDYHAGVRFPFD